MNKRMTQSVVEYVQREDSGSLPVEVREKAKECLIDLVGACFAGSGTRLHRLMLEIIPSLFARGRCPVIGTRLKSSVLGAVLGNGVSGSAWDFDDGHRAPVMEDIPVDVLGFAAGHPAAVVIPSSLAFASERHTCGDRLLEAVVVGYEVGIRYAACRKTESVLANATGNWGVIAAATAGGKIMGLDSGGLSNLFGVAASNLINPPKLIDLKQMPMIKESIGWSGITGAASAVMAEKGVTGIPDVFDNREHFNPVFFEDLGDRYHILNAYFKPYSCCRMLHPAIDAAIRLKDLHRIEADEIRKIVVETSYKAKALDNRRPRTIEEAQYSFPYCMGIALKYGRVDPNVMMESGFSDPVVTELADRTALALDQSQKRIDSVEILFPKKTAARVKMETTKGEYSEYVDCPKGDNGNEVTRDELIEKFNWSAGRILGGRRRQKLLDLLSNIEACGDISEAASLFSVDRMNRSSAAERR